VLLPPEAVDGPEEEPQAAEEPHTAAGNEMEERACELRYRDARAAMRKAQAEVRRFRVGASSGDRTARMYLRTAESRLRAAQNEEQEAYTACQRLQRNTLRLQAKASRLCELNARTSPLLALSDDLLMLILQQHSLEATDLAMLDCTSRRLRDTVWVRARGRATGKEAEGEDGRSGKGAPSAGDHSSSRPRRRRGFACAAGHLAGASSSASACELALGASSSGGSTGDAACCSVHGGRLLVERLSLTEAAARTKAWLELGVSAEAMGPTRPLCASWKQELQQGAILLQETGLWKIHGFSKWSQRRRRSAKPPRLFSDTFVRGGVPWRLLLFPRGNHVEHLSLYLDVADSATLPLGWMRYAKFVLYVLHPAGRARSVSKGTSHIFTSRENDWGFTMMVPLEDLENGGFLQGDTLCLRVDVEEARDGPSDRA